MRAKVIDVGQNGNKTRVTVEVDNRPMPDFTYAPPTDAVKADPAAFEDYQRDVAARRTAHVEKWKNGDRPTKRLLGKMVSLGI